jgi:hypothetical protein
LVGSIGAEPCFRAVGAAIILGIAGCSAPSPQTPTTSAGGGVQQSGMTACDAAMNDTSMSPPRRFLSPPGKWTSPPDTRVVANTLIAAAPNTSHPIPEACGVVRFLVAADGTVQNVTVLAEYPQGIGLGDALLKYMAPVVYPQSAAGGPYAIDIAVKSHRKLMRVPSGA